MKTDKYSILLCSLALLFSWILVSCKKNWLNEKSKSSVVVPASYSDFQALLDNSDVLNWNSPAFGEIASDGHYVTDANYAYLGDGERDAYGWNNDLPVSSINYTDWSSSYTRIFYCNIILEGLDKITPGNPTDQQTWNNLRGQALFQRARCFYELASLWSPHYNQDSTGNEYGIPLRLKSDINLPVKRNTLRETYDQISQDLLEAKDLLPINPLYKTRASRSAAFALLARINLSTEDYSSAGRYADSCLQLYSSLVNYNDLDSTLPYPIPRFNEEVIFHSPLSNYYFFFVISIDTALYHLYAPDDLRKSLFFSQNADGSINFRGSYCGNIAPQFNGLCTDEMLLIHSESLARQGDATGAMYDLNTLLAYRYKTESFIPFSATDAPDALRQILTERKKELLLRGIRWTDLRRLNNDPAYAITLTRTIAGKPVTLEPHSFQYTFPIPFDVIQKSDTRQNPGW